MFVRRDVHQFMRSMHGPVPLRRVLCRGQSFAVDKTPGMLKLDAFLRHSLQDLQRDLLVESGEGGGVRRMITVSDRDRHGVIAETDPHRWREFGIESFMVFPDAPDKLDEATNSSGRSVRTEAEDFLPAQVTSAADILRIQPGHLLVGDAHDVPAGLSNPGRAQSHRLHVALVPLDSDQITHLKGPVHQDHQAAKKVLQAILRRQRHRQPAHADAGDECLSGFAVQIQSSCGSYKIGPSVARVLFHKRCGSDQSRTMSRVTSRDFARYSRCRSCIAAVVAAS
jgi:hypothetical protein